jgi:hypothetical protein
VTRNLLEFFGDDSWQLAKFDRRYSVKIYMRNLKRVYEKIKKQLTKKNNQAYVNNIRLGTKSFFYDIILVCKEGDYTNVWEQMKQRWNEKNCKCLIDFIKGKTPCLDVFEGFSREVSKLDKKHRNRNQPYKKNNTVNLERFFDN